MIPDLGKYAFVVLASYGSSAVLLVGIIVWTVLRGKRVKQRLAEIEARQGVRSHG